MQEVVQHDDLLANARGAPADDRIAARPTDAERTAVGKRLINPRRTTSGLPRVDRGDRSAVHHRRPQGTRRRVPRQPRMIELHKGKGPGAGPFTSRFQIGPRTMLHVLYTRPRERPDDTWLHRRRRRAGDLRLAQRRPIASACAARGPRRPAHVGLFLRNQIEFMPALLRRAVRRRRGRAAQRGLARRAAAAGDRALRRAGSSSRAPTCSRQLRSSTAWARSSCSS